MSVRRVEPGPGQESVWDYPRPPRLEHSRREVRVEVDGITLAASRRARRVLETSHPPVYYVPPEDVRLEFLESSRKSSWCEWKGRAAYYDVVVGERRLKDAAWYYPEPVERFVALKDCIAFYPELVDACYVDGERVRAQAGGFYGGWITSEIVGPFKGEPGTRGW
jgi:uncharacterized protein (DUF427 family)